MIFSIIWCIWNITPQWRTLTISLHVLVSKFANTGAVFSISTYFHIYDLYQWIIFFLGFSTESKTCQSIIMIKIYLSKCKDYQKFHKWGGGDGGGGDTVFLNMIIYIDRWVRARKLIEKSPVPTSFDLLVVCKVIDTWSQFLFFTWFDRSVSFPNIN